MEDTKNCQKIFDEYISLNNQIVARDVGPKGEIVATPINDIEKLFGLRKKVYSCLHELSDEQLIELYGHKDLEEAQKILLERKLKIN
ncbi:MAG: hypothetical protein AAB352_02635 [Patescibacteria group bacterium]